MSPPGCANRSRSQAATSCSFRFPAANSITSAVTSALSALSSQPLRLRKVSATTNAWTFSNTGDLMGYALPDGYEGISKAGVGLGKVARISSYRGFVFGSMATEGPQLEELLGGARAAIDQLCDN